MLPNIKPLLKTVRSLRFTAGILVALSICYLTGLLVPQRALFDGASQYRQWRDESFLHGAFDRLGITDIYTSPLVFILLALFFINLVVVASDRIPVILRKVYLSGDAPEIDADRVRGAAAALAVTSRLDAKDLYPQLLSFFRGKHWAIIPGKGEGGFVAIRNRYSPLGFFLFHGSFLLCLVGGILIAYTRFSGGIGVAEGEAVNGRLDTVAKVTRKPLLLRTLPEMSLRVNSIATRYEEGVASDLAVEIDTVISGVPRRGKIRINDPFREGSVTLVAHNVGLAPLVEVTAADGRVLDTLYAKLNVLKGRSDSFLLGSRNQYLVRVTYFPDYAVYNGVETTRSPEPRNPAFHLVISEGERMVYDGTVHLGEPAPMDDFRITFKELRQWAFFQVIREYGQVPLIIGFIMGSVGLVMRLIFCQKRIQVAVVAVEQGSTAYLLGQADYFGHSFADEMATIAAQLEDELWGNKPHKGALND